MSIPAQATQSRSVSALDLSEVGDEGGNFETQTYHTQLYTGPICDPHIHFFDLEHFSYPWLKGPNQMSRHPLLGDMEAMRKTYLLSDLKADTAKHHVTKFVHIQAECDPTSSLDESKWLESIASGDSSVAGIVAFADLTADDIDTVLAKQAAFPHVRGIRHMLNWHDEHTHLRSHNHNVVKSDKFHRGYAQLAKHKLSFDFHGFHTQLNDALALAKKYPQTTLIVNHSALCIDRTEDGIELWKSGLTALAAEPNTAIKISGVGQTDNQWTAESLRPFVLEIIEIFGFNRAMFASNFPVEKVIGSYDSFYTAFKQIISHFSPEQQKKLFYDNAMRIYRLQ